MIRIALITISTLMIGCGSSESKGSKSQGATTVALNTSDNLPECKDSNKHQLVYVKSEATFYECDGDWSAVSVGATISEVWRYDLKNYDESEDLASPSVSGFEAMLGTIEITKMTNGLIHVTVVGAMLATDTGSDMYHSDFSHSFVLQDNGKEQSFVTKISFLDNFKIRYKVTTNDLSTFKATLASDADFTNNQDVKFELTKQ